MSKDSHESLYFEGRCQVHGDYWACIPPPSADRTVLVIAADSAGLDELEGAPHGLESGPDGATS